MKINTNANVYWHGQIQSIYNSIDPKNNLKYSVLKCSGKCSVVDSLNPDKPHIMRQTLTVFAVGGMSCYVESELDVANNIFIVGKMVTKQQKTGGVYRSQLCLQAEEIYKCDWLKFYGRNI